MAHSSRRQSTVVGKAQRPEDGASGYVASTVEKRGECWWVLGSSFFFNAETPKPSNGAAHMHAPTSVKPEPRPEEYLLGDCRSCHVKQHRAPRGEVCFLTLAASFMCVFTSKFQHEMSQSNISGGHSSTAGPEAALRLSSFQTIRFPPL